MSTAATAPAENFTTGPLYKTLVQVLPIFVLNPFSDTPVLSVPKLRKATGMSHEGVYRWLRKSRLSGEKAGLLLKLANSEENVKVLDALGRTPPSIRDFDPFVYGNGIGA